MKLHLEGSEELNLKREDVFRLLTDPNFIANALPDAQDVKVIDDASIEAKVKIGISFVTIKMQISLKIDDKVPSKHARLLVDGSGSGSAMKIISNFDLEGEKYTTMKWVADAEMTGLMAGIGSTILKGFAEKKVSEIFQGIKRAMEEILGSRNS
jgi:carbon monoxide dehydrogenase subunit G